jgi:hypothetical protein
MSAATLLRAVFPVTGTDSHASSLGADVLDAGIDRDPEDLAALLAQAGDDGTALAISTHNGQCVRYAERLMEILSQRRPRPAVFVGGKLNNSIEDGDSEPRDATDLLRRVGVVPRAGRGPRRPPGWSVSWPSRGRLKWAALRRTAGRFATSHDDAGDDDRADPGDDRLALEAREPAAEIQPCSLPHDKSKNLVTHMQRCYPSSRWRTRQAIRDCNDHSSMKPGEASWENRPPD